jgi:hypothetical protein
MSLIFWLERMNTIGRGNLPFFEPQISDAFAAVDARDGASEKGGESQYGLKECSAVTEVVILNDIDMATNLIERLIREANKGDQAE